MITDEWHPLYISLGRYLGYNLALQHFQGNQYKINVQRPPCLHNWAYTDILSDRTFSREEIEVAIAHAQELIDAEVSPILPW